MNIVRRLVPGLPARALEKKIKEAERLSGAGDRELAFYLCEIKARRIYKDRGCHSFTEFIRGLGKSTLSKRIAREIGSSFHHAQGPSLVDLGSILGILPDLEKGAVFFIDEIHRLPAAVAEILYQALDEGALSIPVVAGGRTTLVKLHLEPFVLVAATTEESLLPAPLRSRFGICEKLEFYSREDLEWLAASAAKTMGIELTAEAAGILVNHARGTPQHSQQSTVDSRQQEAGLGVRSRAELPGRPEHSLPVKIYAPLHVVPGLPWF